MDEHSRRMCKAGRSGLLAALTAVAILATSLSWPRWAAAENWPAWRGDGSGVYPGRPLSTQWDARTNILWKAAVPGEGNSSPIIWDRGVYLTSSQDKGRKRPVLCYDADDGREVWRSEFAVASPARPYPKNGYASPTPVTDGKAVYVFFNAPGRAALRLRVNGHFTASPILAGGCIYWPDEKGRTFVVDASRLAAAKALAARATRPTRPW